MHMACMPLARVKAVAFWSVLTAAFGSKLLRTQRLSSSVTGRLMLGMQATCMRKKHLSYSNSRLCLRAACTWKHIPFWKAPICIGYESHLHTERESPTSVSRPSLNAKVFNFDTRWQSRCFLNSLQRQKLSQTETCGRPAISGNRILSGSALQRKHPITRPLAQPTSPSLKV